MREVDVHRQNCYFNRYPAQNFTENLPSVFAHFLFFVWRLHCLKQMVAKLFVNFVKGGNWVRLMSRSSERSSINMIEHDDGKVTPVICVYNIILPKAVFLAGR